MDEERSGSSELVLPANAGKVKASHLQRVTYIYVRQSTMHQVVENTESRERQYALQQRAVALGWPVERVRVIDSDVGQSGASAVDRAGFQELVSEVSLGRAGLGWSGGITPGAQFSGLAAVVGALCADGHADSG